jgi:hypothetical protein
MSSPSLKVGDRCVAVRGVPPGPFNYCAPGVYVVAARKRDGALIWRHEQDPLGYVRGGLPVGFRSQRKAAASARAIADELSCPVLLGVRHNQLVAVAP